MGASNTICWLSVIISCMQVADFRLVLALDAAVVSAKL